MSNQCLEYIITKIIYPLPDSVAVVTKSTSRVTTECQNHQYTSCHRNDNLPAPDWCFVFAVRDVDLSEDVETTSESLAPSLTLASPQCVPENKVIQSEVKLGELHDCIRRVREGPSSLPSISLYTVVNAHQGYGIIFILCDIIILLYVIYLYVKLLYFLNTYLDCYNLFYY